MRALLAGALLLAACAAAEPAAPTPDDCVEIGLQSNGFHSNVVLPADALAADHPLRQLFPRAAWFVVGWGDEDFFRAADGGDFAQGWRASFAGGPTVVHAVALDIAPERYFPSVDTIYAPASRAGAAALARYIDQEIVRSEDGAGIVVAAGHYPGRSLFLRGHADTFHAFNNCNHWTARALRAAGLPLRGSMTADGLAAQLHRIEASCPAPAPN